MKNIIATILLFVALFASTIRVLKGGTGSVANGDVILDGGNRSAYIASPTNAEIRDILIAHGLMEEAP